MRKVYISEPIHEDAIRMLERSFEVVQGGGQYPQRRTRIRLRSDTGPRRQNNRGNNGCSTRTARDCKARHRRG